MFQGCELTGIERMLTPVLPLDKQERQVPVSDWLARAKGENCQVHREHRVSRSESLYSDSGITERWRLEPRAI